MVRVIPSRGSLSQPRVIVGTRRRRRPQGPEPRWRMRQREGSKPAASKELMGGGVLHDGTSREAGGGGGGASLRVVWQGGVGAPLLPVAGVGDGAVAAMAPLRPTPSIFFFFFFFFPIPRSDMYCTIRSEIQS